MSYDLDGYGENTKDEGYDEDGDDDRDDDNEDDDDEDRNTIMRQDG